MEEDARQPAPAMPPWGHCFKAPGPASRRRSSSRQLDVKLFALRSSLTYVGPSDVEAPREVGPGEPADDRPDVGARPDALVRQPLRSAHAGRAAARPARRATRRRPGFDRRRRRPAVPRHARLPRRAAAAPLADVGRRRLRHAVVGRRLAAGSAIVLWTVLAVFGMVCLAIGLATWSLPWLLVAALLPFPAAAAVGQAVRRRRARRRQRAVAGAAGADRRARLRRLLADRAGSAPAAGDEGEPSTGEPAGVLTTTGKRPDSSGRSPCSLPADARSDGRSSTAQGRNHSSVV